MGQSMIMVMVILASAAAACSVVAVILFLNRSRLSSLFGGGGGNTNDVTQKPEKKPKPKDPSTATVPIPGEWKVPNPGPVKFYVGQCMGYDIGGFSNSGFVQARATLANDSLRTVTVTGDKPCCTIVKTDMKASPPNFTYECSADESYAMQGVRYGNQLLFPKTKCVLTDKGWVFNKVTTIDTNVPAVPDGMPCTCDTIRKLYGNSQSCQA